MHINHGGRVALVTGAAQGIGQAISKGLHEGGARVHVADRDATGVTGFATMHGLTPHVLDVSERKAAADVKTFGSPAIKAGLTKWMAGRARAIIWPDST